MHTYTLASQLYVINGQTITLMPGTVLRGTYTSGGNPNSLIIARGGKIIADGTASCPIVMTSTEDNLDGNFPICAAGRWGGLVILGKANNNLQASDVSCAVNAAGVKTAGYGFVEGFPSTNPFNIYGATPGTEDDNDNSGILRYVTVKAAGTEVAPANELNGISLGSVGRGTTIEHIEIVGNDDDGIEFFGGTVNVKYVAMWWVNDDMFDWDQNWRGNAQFLFGIQGGASVRAIKNGADSGLETDGDDKKDPANMSHPVIYNATFIGDNILPTVGGPNGSTAWKAKERTEGEVYNSIFSNFILGFDLNKVRTDDAYDNWFTDGTLKSVNNDWVGISSTLGALTITEGTVRRAANATELAKFTADGNKVVASIGGFSYPANLLICGTPGSISAQFDAQPNPERRGAAAPVTTTPVNGFFTPVSYRGAFGIADGNWLEGWSFGVQNNVTNGIITGPGDVNKSGTVDATDLGEVVDNFANSYSK